MTNEQFEIILNELREIKETNRLIIEKLESFEEPEQLSDDDIIEKINEEKHHCHHD